MTGFNVPITFVKRYGIVPELEHYILYANNFRKVY